MSTPHSRDPLSAAPFFGRFGFPVPWSWLALALVVILWPAVATANDDDTRLAPQGAPDVSNVPAGAAATQGQRSSDDDWADGTSGVLPTRILFYRDYRLGTCAYQAVLATGEFGTVTFTSSPTQFRSLLLGGTPWDLVVCANQASYNLNTFQSALVTFRAERPQCGIIISEWSVSSADQYFPQLGFTHSTPINVYGTLTPEPTQFLAGLPAVSTASAGWGKWNTGTIGGGTVAARGPSGNAMVVRSGNTIVNGFLSDCLSPGTSATALVRREFETLLGTSRIRLSSPTNAGNTTCFAVGQDIVYDVFVDMPPFTVAAGQFSVQYDRDVLSFVAVEPGDPPYTSIPLSIVNQAAGTVFWLSSVPSGATGTSASSRMARLRFRALQNDCDDDAQVAFDPLDQPIVVAAGSGASAMLPLVNPLPVVIDGTAPTFVGVPPSLTIAADAGTACQGTRVLTPPTATDSCSAATVTWTRSDGATTLSAPWPCGTTTVTWLAVDACGRQSTATTSTTVTATNLVNVTVSYAGSGYAASMTRCIDIQIGSQLIRQLMTFAHGTATATIEVPFAVYGCATIDDSLHSVVSRVGVSIDGTRYRISASGADALRNGDLDNDNVINVVDWAIYVVRDGMSMPVNTDCSTTGFHPDFNGSGTVTAADGAFITSNLLFVGSTPCGTSGLQAPPLTRITVDELAAIIGPDAVLADLNGDGVVDVGDMERWAAKNWGEPTRSRR